MGGIPALVAVRGYLPATKVDNEALAVDSERWTAARILGATGVRVRGVASPEEDASDLGTQAAQRLFSSSKWDPGSIDFLVYCTQSSPYRVPATSCVIHERLGLRPDCGTLDLNHGCSGFVYGLSVAKGLVAGGLATAVLLITADTYSRFIAPHDIGARAVFGDGAAASIVARVDSDEEALGPFVFGTDGRGARHLCVLDALHMDGGEVFNFTIRTVPDLVRDLLRKAGTSLSDVDYVICHQANGFILEHLRRLIAVPRDRFANDIELVGNTVSSTIPIALESALARGCVKDGSRVMLVGFGAGYSWGATMITWHEAA